MHLKLKALKFVKTLQNENIWWEKIILEHIESETHEKVQ